MQGGSKKETYQPNMKLVHKYNKFKDKQKKVEYKGRDITLYRPYKADGGRYKLKVYVEDDTGKVRKVKFGHNEYEDYTIHKDESRRKNYCARSAGIAEKYGSDVTSANFWSRMVLWNCPN